jgi:hypothetical protein
MAIKPERVAELNADGAMLRAQIVRMREQLATGELIRLEPFNAALFSEARRIRDAIMSGPVRYAAELAAELQVEQWLMHQVLNAGVRVLLELAAGHGPFPETLAPGVEAAAEPPLNFSQVREIHRASRALDSDPGALHPVSKGLSP